MPMTPPFCGDRNGASYPNEKMRAVPMSVSRGSHFDGQKRSRSWFLHHVAWLEPPRPWMKMMSADGSDGGV